MNPAPQVVLDAIEFVKGETESVERLAVDATETASDTLQLLEETLHVSKRDVVTGTVRVTTRTETRDEVAEVSLDRNVVEVVRVPVDQVVDVAPTVRTEGDVMIVPVLEERFTVVRQLYLTAELHIRHRVETGTERVPVQLRRHIAIVERVDAEGRVTAEPNESA